MPEYTHEQQTREWQRIFEVVQRRLHKPAGECTIPEIRQALLDEQTEAHFNQIVVHTAYEDAQVCGCTVVIPKRPDGTEDYGSIRIDHVCGI